MTNVSALSDSAAVAFLEWLDPTGRHNLVAIDPVTKAVEAETFDFGALAATEFDVRQWVEARNGRMNLYFSINEPRHDAREGTKLRRDEIGALRAFHVDIDSLEGEPDWDMDCLPSAVIDSGGGRWGFWKLAEKKSVISAEIAEIEAQNRALTARFHGDTQAHNLDRIARLPGTLNIPNEAKRKKGRVEVASRVVTVGGPVWEPGEVAAWCPPAAATEAAQPKQDQTPLADLDAADALLKAAKYLIDDAPEAIEGEGGDETTYRVAARLKDFGVSQDMAAKMLSDLWNDRKAVPPWNYGDLLDKVRNAYRHGTAAPGRNSPALAETEFEAVNIDISISDKPQRRAMQSVPFDAITQDLKAESRHLIDGWYDQGTMIVTYGESNSGKTHVVLDQALAIAAGRTWAGKQTHKGLVVYVAAEGGPGIVRRVMAHRIFRPEHKELPFHLVSFPIDLMHNANDSKALIKLVKAAEAQTGQQCVMLVVDTLSRALAGGDENSSADMGAFVKRCDEVRAACGAALHVIHHAGKNTAKGARGHSLLRAAVDTEIEIENGAILCRKQRDMEGAPELRFSYKPVELGARADGSKVQSVVLDVWESTEFEVEMTPQQENVWRAACAYVERETQNTQNKDGTVSDKRTVILTPQNLTQMTEGTLSEKTLERAFRHLVEIGVFSKSKRGQYYLDRTVIPSSNRQTE